MLRKLIYRPRINTALRTLLRPLAPVVPAAFRFPIVEPFRLDLDDDISLVIIANETSYVSKRLFWEGIRGYEFHLVPLFRNLSRTADIILDVGANLGYYAMLAAATNRAAKIAAFEPSPSAFHYLKVNLEVNGFDHVRAERLALSDRNGSVSFFEARNPRFPGVERHLTGASGIDEPGEGYVHERSFEVPTVTLDDYVSEHFDGRVDLVKIDAEASEHLVLRGGTRILERDRPIIFCEALVGRIEEHLEEIFAASNYAMYNAESDRLRPVSRLVGENLTTRDFVMVPREVSEDFHARYAA